MPVQNNTFLGLIPAVSRDDVCVDKYKHYYTYYIIHHFCLSVKSFDDNKYVDSTEIKGVWEKNRLRTKFLLPFALKYGKIETV